MKLVCLLVVFALLGNVYSDSDSDSADSDSESSKSKSHSWTNFFDLGEFQFKIQRAIDKWKNAARDRNQRNLWKRNKGVHVLDEESTVNQLQLFAEPEEAANKLAEEASIQLSALKELVSLKDLDTHRLEVDEEYLTVWKERFGVYCSPKYTGEKCNSTAYYRRADGSCNNLKHPTWGAHLAPQSREIPAMYDDGIDSPRVRDRSGATLPSAREISNIVHKVEGKSPRNERLTMMVMQWGQFVDHEFVATPVLKDVYGRPIECCGEDNADQPECFPIWIPSDDPFFQKSCMSLVRSAPILNNDCEPGQREQMNQVTSFFDGSAIYGSTQANMNELRSMEGGMLRTLETNEDLLPKWSDSKCRKVVEEDYCQRAGDARVNVVPSLGWSHTCFFREHNRIAKRLAEINPHWDDETIFQQTRRIVSAIEQVINYKEYLPAIFNEETMVTHDLKLGTNGYRQTYNKTVNPSIANVFSTAAFRFGHSQIANYQAIMNSYNEFAEVEPIESTYHRPHMIITEQGKQLDGLVRWLIADSVPLADGLFEDGVRDKLFIDSNGNSLDLPALNIQRGRDHGLPGYNHWRVHCGLEKATMTEYDRFVLPDHGTTETSNLEEVYRHVDDIDLFAGAMTETLLPDSSVGPTFACLLGRQFNRLMTGDRYWHETSDDIIRFTEEQLSEIRNITLARVICNNFNVDELQPNVFLCVGPGNERCGCSTLPDIDLKAWKACEEPLSDGRPNFGNCTETESDESDETGY